MWNLVKRMRKRGVLGINARNGTFVLPHNQRQHFPLVDDKLQTKQLAIKAGLAVPALYEVITSEYQIKNLDKILSPYSDFVIKPAHGAGGDGIVVITNKIRQHYRQVNGELLTTDALSYHLSCLLAGGYSLGGHPDTAIIEQRVIIDPIFSQVSYEGVPDIRIITLLGYPAMAMLRLPTRLSGGKANLHQGAIGVGIDLATGTTLGGVFHNDTIDYHPDTQEVIAGITIPYWDKILKIAASCYELTELGYLGVDIVLDKQQGPLILELNARPGLNIQIANREGLLNRYHAIEKQAATSTDAISSRIEFSKQCFSQ